MFRGIGTSLISLELLFEQLQHWGNVFASDYCTAGDETRWQHTRNPRDRASGYSDIIYVCFLH